LISEHYSILRCGGGGARTTLVCGVVAFELPIARQLVRMLPQVIHVDSTDSHRTDRMRGALELMVGEMRELSPGGEAVTTRLADILVIESVRTWLQDESHAQQGWLAALRDKQIGRALAAVHRDPAAQWTLASLAREAAMSRSAFAARFTRLVGEPVMQYVTRWRMNLALSWLREEGATVAEVAPRLGYASDAAFSRAFKATLGIPPGAARRGGLPLATSGEGH
jgi:AraC-like DNA-binding protein